MEGAPCRFGLAKVSSAAFQIYRMGFLSSLSFCNSVPVNFFLMWKIIFYEYVCPLGHLVKNILEMRSKQPGCSLAAMDEAAAEVYPFFFSCFMELQVDFLRLSGCYSQFRKGYQK